MNTTIFSKSVDLPVSAEEAFAWHARPGALNRLIPPWEKVKILERGNGIADGSQVVLVNSLGPLRLRWVAEHCEYEKGRHFCDVQREGPFAKWEHSHRFTPADNGSVLEDHIEYQIPGGSLGKLLGQRLIRRKIEQMFAYRHRTTADDLRAHARYAGQQRLRIAVTGSRGLVGKELVPLLTTGGHQILPIVRGQAGPQETAWDPQAEQYDAAPLAGVDAVVHLAGENIAAARWSEAQKERIRQSRVRGTRILCEALARLPKPPRVLVAASATGFYGDRDDEVLDETSPAGKGFLAEVAQQWEAATQPASDAGVRVVRLRFGVVLSPRGGALAKMLPPFQAGGGGKVGSGEQFWSWVGIDDAAGAILHALMTDSLTGPVNVVSPNPTTNAEFTQILARVLRRPAFVSLPATAARLVLGEMADELLLSSTRVHPQKLLEAGYIFRHPDLERALRHLLGRTQ